MNHFCAELDLECILELDGLLYPGPGSTPGGLPEANIGILVRSKSLMLIVRPRFTGILIVATCFVQQLKIIPFFCILYTGTDWATWTLETGWRLFFQLSHKSKIFSTKVDHFQKMQNYRYLTYNSLSSQSLNIIVFVISFIIS